MLVSDFYFDKYLFESDPRLLQAVTEHSAPLIPQGTEILAGLELGGVPLSTALSLLTGIPQVMVRKEAKGYGTAKLAEGPDISGRRLTVIEDVITSGGQVVLSTDELRSRGAPGRHGGVCRRPEAKWRPGARQIGGSRTFDAPPVHPGRDPRD